MREKKTKEEQYMLYKILGTKIDASESEIKRQYRIMAMKFHPDRNTDEKSKEIF